MDLIRFESDPSRYRHWRLEFEGPVARLSLNVAEDQPLRPGYALKLNSYDLGVDIELADAIQRIRFEHPDVSALVLTSAKERVFCAGANIPMLGSSSHPFKVNFCKFTNETRLYLEELSAESGIPTLCAVSGICAGGGYELALSCDRIVLVDDGNAAVSLPETPLLGVLPGTGGLTRVIDKRKVRRDLADVFCTMAEGIRGRRAAEWNLVDRVLPKSRFAEEIDGEALTLAARSRRLTFGLPVRLAPLQGSYSAEKIEHRHVTALIDAGRRVATVTIRGPSEEQAAAVAAAFAGGATGRTPANAGGVRATPGTPSGGATLASADLWPFRAFR
jgi:benzoyl-CoA-dihydrodiol lyase